MERIEEAFRKTTKLLLGKALHQMTHFGEWLGRKIPASEMCEAPLSGRNVCVPYPILDFVPREKVAGLDSLDELSARRIEISNGDSLKDIAKKVEGIEAYVTEFVEGENLGVWDSTVYMNLTHAYKIVDCFNSKYVAYNFWISRNEYTFGCYRTFDCKFCIKCYNSKNITRGFEVDACHNCSDVMFCHNCENVRDSMFCFNTKNKRYAIANTEVGREEFMRFRGMLRNHILRCLEEKGQFEPDIFTIGCRG
ncbi:MAG: hypothetical protein ABIG39_07825 [Candidatus Micrarchaeota archaeon]